MLWSIVHLSLQALARNALRSSLTMLGVVIGVAAVITIATLGGGASSMIASNVASMGDRLLFVNPSAGGNRQPFGSATPRPFSMDDVDAIRSQVDGLAGVAPSVSASVTAVYGSENWPATVTGVTEDYFPVRDATIARGSAFDTSHYVGGKLGCILGKTVREELFGSTDPVGAVIRVGKSSCEVVGELESKGQSGFGSDQDDVILAPLRAVQSRLSGNQDITSIAVSVVPWADMENVSQSIGALLRERRNIQDSDSEDFQVMVLTQVASVLADVTGLLTLFLSAIAAVSLLVGGIGIMNIMLVSVTERTREIGIRLAIGAFEREVLLQFLVEAVILTTVGGTIGVLIGLTGSFAVSRMLDFPFVVDPTMIFVAFLFCVFIGVAFGYLPARRAASLDPIEALRRE
jgi:putative ABC transport system permease protein